MKDNEPIISNKPICVLLADDDSDDRHFFEKAIKTLPIATILATVQDGEELMNYLNKNFDILPDVLFLDINMPKKNGLECLVEIQQNLKLKDLPVIIYSTSLHDDVADLLYNKGAYYYVRKNDIAELKMVLHHILTLLAENRFIRPVQKEFIFSLA